MKILIRVFCAVCSLFSLHVNCQTLVNTTGTTITNNSYSVDYSVGEISITTLNNQNNVRINYLTQGLLQPFVKATNPACEIINDSLIYFPNPGHDKIRIVGTYNWITNYTIFDASGRLMANSNFYNNYIDLSRLAAGVYIIILYPGCDNHFKTLKIMKQ